MYGGVAKMNKFESDLTSEVDNTQIRRESGESELREVDPTQADTRFSEHGSSQGGNRKKKRRDSE